MRCPGDSFRSSPSILLAQVRPLVFLGLLMPALGGCTTLSDYINNGFKVGPNCCAPLPAPVAEEWIEKRARKDSDDLSKWWMVFEDKVLDDLVGAAYRQNLTLREAGFRIMQARAQLNIATSSLFPQTQTANGSYERVALSAETVGGKLASNRRFFDQWSSGFSLAWELDFWGRFRRGIESASAILDASVHDYDDVLVTLLGDVATNYVQMRTLEQRIKYAQENVDLQSKSVKVVEGRLIVGLAKKLDVDQAKSVLLQTEAAIPELEISLRQTTNQLCILLGIPPEELRKKFGPAPIPSAQPDVAIGIPADLLRRRPDIRRAERLAAAQCALIGVAEADFYPRISLTGTLSYTAEQFKDMFRSSALNGNFGPSFQWQILAYGKILNNVRLQDARFQELTASYQGKVLTAQKEVENGLVTFLKAKERTQKQSESVFYIRDAAKIVNAQFEVGTVNIAQLILILQDKVQREDTLAVAQGEIATGLIQVYRAMGGGWQIRCNQAEPLTPPQPADRLADDSVPAPRPATFGPPF